jgi:superfamily II DNA/RNA helicase
VLDEADEMLRMGFIDPLMRILEAEARGSRSFAIEATTVVSADGPIW